MSSSTLERERTTGTRFSVDAEPTDEDLLVRYRDYSDREAFDTLVHRYEKELYSYLRRYLGDASMAEDVFQQAFLQLHLKCDQFEEGRRVRPWLYTIATHQAIDAQRKNKRHNLISLDRRRSADGQDEVSSLMQLLTSNEAGPVSRTEANERREWVQNAVSQLPEQLQSAVNLIFYQGLKYREAAEVLDVPTGTVKSRAHTAVLKLAEMWKRAHSSGEE